MGNSVIETMRVSPAASVIISMSLILFLGFLTTRITKRLRLPNVTAYILTGVLMGPWCLNVIPVSFVRGSGFLPDIALSFIAFSTGEYFKLETLRKNGAKVLVITALEALLTTALVFFLMYRVLQKFNEAIPEKHKELRSIGSFPIEMFDGLDPTYLISMNIGGMWNVICQWVRGGMKDDPAQITKDLTRYIINMGEYAKQLVSADGKKQD